MIAKKKNNQCKITQVYTNLYVVQYTFPFITKKMSGCVRVQYLDSFCIIEETCICYVYPETVEV